MARVFVIYMLTLILKSIIAFSALCCFQCAIVRLSNSLQLFHCISIYFEFWRSSIWISCSMPIISSSPPIGAGFIAYQEIIVILIETFWIHRFIGEMFFCTFSCSAKLYACFSASRARLSFSFKENIATDRARLMRLCLTRDFFAASSAAIRRKWKQTN